MQDFDLIVIGSGPAGQRAAVQAAKIGKHAAVIERRQDLGGVCINTGTIPSKTLREAVLDLSGLRQRSLYGESYRRDGEITAADLMFRTSRVMEIEQDVIKAQLVRNGVRLFGGAGRFVGPHEVAVMSGEVETARLRAPYVVIAVGTTPGIPPGLVVDHRTVLTSDDVLSLPRIPRSLLVVGAGIIGTEYATMFAVLGVDVTLLDRRPDMLEMVDREILETFVVQARALGVTLRLGEEVDHVDPVDDHVVVVMKSGKRIATEMVLVSAGRQGATTDLALDTAGLTADARGRIAVNEHYQTTVPHIYAAGDVIGAPALASTSAEQGRLAACHAFGIASTSVPELFPYGIYAIPEIGWVGRTEAELTAHGVPFETGIARYREIARGQILGDSDGMLKLIFHLDSMEILGVWVIGTQATELVHIGQAVMALGGTLEYFLRSVFNYPTLAECYKVAALDGYNKIRSLGLATHVAPGLAEGKE